MRALPFRRLIRAVKSQGYPKDDGVSLVKSLGLGWWIRSEASPALWRRSRPSARPALRNTPLTRLALAPVVVSRSLFAVGFLWMLRRWQRTAQWVTKG